VSLDTREGKMAVGKFDEQIKYHSHGELFDVDAKGPMDLDTSTNEKPMVVCVRIFQDDALLAECNGADHDPAQTFPPNQPDRWQCEGHTSGGTPKEEPALALAVLVTSSDDGGFNTYTWTQIVQLVHDTAADTSG
jgi:hypothetical protein